LSSFTKFHCGSESKSQAYAYIYDSTNCAPLTAGKLNKTAFSTIFADKENKMFNLSIAYPKASLIIYTNCDYNATTTTITSNQRTDTGLVEITITSKEVCPVLIGIKSFWVYFKKYQIAFAVVCWIAGLFLIICGLKFFKFVMFVIGFVAVSLLLIV